MDLCAGCCSLGSAFGINSVEGRGRKYGREKLSHEAISTKNSADQESSEGGKVCPDGARGPGLYTPVDGSLDGGCHRKKA